MLAPSLSSEDILILLKLCLRSSGPWDDNELASELGHSAAEVRESINRLTNLGFIDLDNKVLLSTVKKFLLFDLHDLFAVAPGKLTTGTLTGAKPGQFLKSDLPYASIWVWPNHDGKDLGYEITPLSPHCSFASLNDPKLRELLAVTETLRVVGVKAREWSRERLEAILG